jgi:predicted nucleotidyltransferase
MPVFRYQSLSRSLRAMIPNCSPSVEKYISSVVGSCEGPDSGIISAVLFGSAATGSYSPEISDVDLLIVLHDRATAEDRCRARDTISDHEDRCGVRRQRPHRRGALDAFADRVTANVRSFFVCTRADLLSGEPARILGISALQASFVDRVAIPSILASGLTIWGEHLLPHVPFPPIRRFDVAKAFFSLFNQALFAVVAYPLLSAGTKCAMDTLKRSVHNCYFCYHSRGAQLSVEVAFFQRRLGAAPDSTLAQLLRLRTAYQPSFAFVLRCLPTLVRLHSVTAWDNRFPQEPRFSQN